MLNDVTGRLVRQTVHSLLVVNVAVVNDIHLGLLQ